MRLLRLVFIPCWITVSAGAQVPAPAARIQVYTPTVTNPSTAGISAKRVTHTRLSVNAAAADWTNSGVAVLAGDTLTFTATGEIALAGHTLTPAGMTRGWRDMLRSFPVDTANAGALVGRIGDNAAALPFTVGTAATVTAAQSGTLFLRVNASAVLPATGTVHVDLRITPAETGKAAQLQAHVQQPFLGLSTDALDALPRRVADRDGAPGDAINFALLGTERQVHDAFARAGWAEVDADAASAVLHGLLNTLEHKPYVEVPMSTLYLFGRPQDLSFARASAISVASERHHLRCWKTNIVANGVPLWVGAATHDVGFARDRRNGNVTHRIAPEIDLERDFLRDTFLSGGAAASVAYFTPRDAVRDGTTATGGNFHTDGRMLLLSR